MNPSLEEHATERALPCNDDLYNNIAHRDTSTVLRSGDWRPRERHRRARTFYPSSVSPLDVIGRTNNDILYPCNKVYYHGYLGVA